jgi:hypothetical protein
MLKRSLGASSMPIIWCSNSGGTTPTYTPTFSITQTCTTIPITSSTIADWYYTNQYTNQLANTWPASGCRGQLAHRLCTAQEAMVQESALINAKWMLLAQAKAAAEQREQDAYLKAIREHDQQEINRIEHERAERERVRVAAVEEQRRVEAERQRAAAEREATRKAAAERANELLSQHLSPAQRETFLKNGWFIVEGGKSKTKYRIRGNTLTANVDVLDNKDKVTHRLCAHPRFDACPMADHLLAQKMTLEFDEDSFLRTANRHA